MLGACALKGGKPGKMGERENRENRDRDPKPKAGPVVNYI